MRPLADGRFEPLYVPLGPQRFSVREDRQIASAGTWVNVWESAEDVTPCLELTIDLLRRK